MKVSVAIAALAGVVCATPRRHVPYVPAPDIDATTPCETSTGVPTQRLD